jgi:hypothetical protein
VPFLNLKTAVCSINTEVFATRVLRKIEKDVSQKSTEISRGAKESDEEDAGNTSTHSANNT